MSAVSADLFSADLEGSYPFLSELMAMRRRIRSYMSGGGSDGHSARAAIVQLLSEALATELTCVARYRDHARLGLLVDQVREEFLKHAREEQGHANLIAERIAQLGGALPVPVQPPSLPDASGEELDAEEVIDLLEEDLIAERIAIDSYREIMQFVGDHDASTVELLQTILRVEVGHARELASIRAELMRRDRSGGTSVQLPQLDLQYA